MIKNLKFNKRILSLVTAFTLMFSGVGAKASNSEYSVDTNKVVITEDMDVSTLDTDTVYFDGENIAYNFSGFDINKMAKNKNADFTLMVSVKFSDDYSLSTSQDYSSEYTGGWVENQRKGISQYNVTGITTVNGKGFKLDFDDFNNGVIKFENLFGVSFEEFMRSSNVKEGQPYYLMISYNTTGATNMNSLNFYGRSPIYYYYEDDKCASELKEDGANIRFDINTGKMTFVGLYGTDGQFLDVIVNGENITLKDPYIVSGVNWYDTVNWEEVTVDLYDTDFTTSALAYNQPNYNPDECITPRIGTYCDYYFGYYDNDGEFVPGKINDGDEYMFTISSYGYYTKTNIFNLDVYQSIIRDKHRVGNIAIDINNPYVFDINTHDDCNGLTVNIHNKKSFDLVYSTNVNNGHIDLMNDFNEITNGVLDDYGCDFVIEVIEHTNNGDYVYRSGIVHYYVDNYNNKFGKTK